MAPPALVPRVMVPPRATGPPERVSVAARQERAVQARTATAAFQLTTAGDGQRRWLRLPLPGQDPDSDAPPQLRGRIAVDERFRAAVESILEPGSTVVVTPDSLRSSHTGLPLTALEEGE